MFSTAIYLGASKCCICVILKETLLSAGEEWREMDDKEKAPYEQASQEEQKKYEKAMAEYRKVTFERYLGVLTLTN